MQRAMRHFMWVTDGCGDDGNGWDLEKCHKHTINKLPVSQVGTLDAWMEFWSHCGDGAIVAPFCTSFSNEETSTTVASNAKDPSATPYLSTTTQVSRARVSVGSVINLFFVRTQLFKVVAQQNLKNTSFGPCETLSLRKIGRR